MRRTWTSLLAAAAVAGPAWVTSAGSTAAAAGSTACEFTGVTVAITPGLTTRMGTAEFRQINQGTITCTGPVAGHEVTGPGLWSASYGSLIGSCAGGKGVVTDIFEFPTRTGTLKLVNKAPYTFGPLQGGVVGGEFDGDTMKGSFSVFPAEGDCIIRPLTQVATEARGTLK